MEDPYGRAWLEENRRQASPASYWQRSPYTTNRSVAPVYSSGRGYGPAYGPGPGYGSGYYSTGYSTATSPGYNTVSFSSQPQPLVEFPPTIKRDRGTGGGTLTDVAFTEPAAYFHVVSPEHRRAALQSAVAGGSPSTALAVPSARRRERLSRGMQRESPAQQHHNAQLVEMRDGGVVGNTRIVYDVYDVDEPVPVIAPEVWHPLAFYYRSCE